MKDISIQTTTKSFSKFRYLLFATTLATYLMIVLGGVFRVTAVGPGCADWPLCNGSFLPPKSFDASLDYFHRLLALVSFALTLLSSVIAFRRYRDIKLLSAPLFIAVGLGLIQMLLGGVVANLNEPPNWVSLHLGLSLAMLACLVVPTTLAYVLVYDPTQLSRLLFQSSFSRKTIVLLIVIFMVLVSGAFVSSSGAAFACPSWPLCDGSLFPTNIPQGIDMLHRITVAAGSVFVLALLNNAWKTQRSQRAILTAATATVILFFSQAFIGAIKYFNDAPIYLIGLHVATAAAVWAAAVILWIFSGLASRTDEEEQAEAKIPIEFKSRVKDMLVLTKPIIVLLLLVTTYAGMVVGARAIPDLSITFWTLLGGALAAGGSGAVNQYIDREIDQRMTRTAKRPIASGRMTPAEGLAFGVGTLLISFYLLAGLVNLLAALLSLVGMIYYVLIYSIFLKTTTVQNIVIGGGAGAIPPLVGWAATTGSLSLSALFMFAIIFMWTPPHFWALALIREKEYARAGIPMLPVIRGPEETRLQIFIYTIELVALTILMPILGLAGAFYFAASLLLGGWLLLWAWRVWRQGGNKIAWKMYRYSSMYLAFLFAAMMIDALIS